MQSGAYSQRYGQYICTATMSKSTGIHARRNEISYYVEGSKDSVTRLKLILNAYDNRAFEESRDQYLLFSEQLSEAALSKPLPEEIREAIKTGKPGEWASGRFLLALQKQQWQDGKGFSLKLMIE